MLIRVILYQCQTNIVKQIGFVLRGMVNTYNKRINDKFKRGVADLVAAREYSTPSDFISVSEAQELILIHTGQTVCHTTAVRWITQNSLGSKLSGNKGQWIVDRQLLKDFLKQTFCH